VHNSKLKIIKEHEYIYRKCLVPHKLINADNGDAWVEANGKKLSANNALGKDANRGDCFTNSVLAVEKTGIIDDDISRSFLGYIARIARLYF